MWGFNVHSLPLYAEQSSAWLRGSSNQVGLLLEGVEESPAERLIREEEMKEDKEASPKDQ